MNEKTYPAFVKTPEDQAAFDVAREGGWSEYIYNPGDILAIKEGCWFDIEAAQHAESFFLLLHHSKGKWAGQPFELQPWQRDQIIYPLFGWKRADGTRRFRKGLVFIAKKNGKSTLCAGLSLYLLIGDREQGAEVYNAAVDRSQVANVMDEAKNMVRRSPALSKRLEIRAGVHRINFLETKSWYQALSADADTAEGKNIHGLICDEIHAWKNRDLWKALNGGGIAREQPLFLAITTAGEDTTTFAYEEYTHAKAVLAGTKPDWTYFAFIAEGNPDLDPGDEKNWELANPGLGVSPTKSALADLWRKAKGNPEDENDFKRYHLNLWTQAAKAAIPLTVWDKGGVYEASKYAAMYQELLGRPCWGALDLGANSDLTSLELVFPEPDDYFKVLTFIFCPEDRSRDRGQKKVSYMQWFKDKHMEQTPGNTIDRGYIRKRVKEITGDFKLKALGVDLLFKNMGEELIQGLVEDSLPVIPYPNNISSMAVPTKKFMELVFAGKLLHGGHPVLRWMASNLVMKKDNQGNMMPDKSKEERKIDGIAAICMCFGVMALPGQSKPVNPGKIIWLGEESEEPDESTKESAGSPSVPTPPIRLFKRIPNLSVATQSPRLIKRIPGRT